MTEFTEQDLSGARFERVSLRGAIFQEVYLTDVQMRDVDLSGLDLRAALVQGGRLRGVELVDVQISGELRDVVVNGVDIGPLVEAELDRRMPERAAMRPEDPAGFARAWEILERLWDGTVARARTFPAEALDLRVDGEWSFLQTLRHLNFATACWVNRMVLGDPAPWHRLDLPWEEAPPMDGISLEIDARPRLDEVLVVRAERQATVRHVIESLSGERLDTEVSSDAPGWPRGQTHTVRECLRVVLNEEWEHRLYAERDLSRLAETRES